MRGTPMAEANLAAASKSEVAKLRSFGGEPVADGLGVGGEGWSFADA